MKNASDTSTPLRLLFPAEHFFWKEKPAQEKVERYVAGLLSALGVPGQAEFLWEKQPQDTTNVEIFVNNTPARLRFTTSSGLKIAPEQFQFALCEDILRNRALFLTPEVVGHAAAGKSSSTFRQLGEKNQLRAAQILFAQGFGLQRVASFEATESMPETWAEACIGALESTRLVMLAPASQIDPDDDPHDLNRLIESASYFVDAVFRIKGVPIPKLVGEKRADFAEGEVAFQVNDLLFPTRKIGDVQGENVQFVNFLTSHSACFLHRGSVKFLLDSLEAPHPNLLTLTRTRFSTDFIVSVLRYLAAENISIRPLTRILEILAGGGRDIYHQQPSLTEVAPLSETVHLAVANKTLEQLDAADWAEFVRLNLKNAIVNRALPHFENATEMSCFFLENNALEKIAAFDSLALAEQAALRKSLHEQIGKNYFTPAGRIRPVVAPAAFRKKISELIAFEFPETPVFSIQECLPQIVARFDVSISL
jgi:hypothetical protein